VVDGGVSREGYGAAGGDGGGGAGAREAALVAAEIGGGEIGDGRVVVGVLADVLVLGTLGSVDGQVLEDVWICKCVF